MNHHMTSKHLTITQKQIRTHMIIWAVRQNPSRLTLQSPTTNVRCGERIRHRYDTSLCINKWNALLNNIFQRVKWRFRWLPTNGIDGTGIVVSLGLAASEPLLMLPMLKALIIHVEVFQDPLSEFKLRGALRNAFRATLHLERAILPPCCEALLKSMGSSNWSPKLKSRCISWGSIRRSDGVFVGLQAPKLFKPSGDGSIKKSTSLSIFALPAGFHNQRVAPATNGFSQFTPPTKTVIGLGNRFTQTWRNLGLETLTPSMKGIWHVINGWLSRKIRRKEWAFSIIGFPEIWIKRVPGNATWKRPLLWKDVWSRKSKTGNDDTVIWKDVPHGAINNELSNLRRKPNLIRARSPFARSGDRNRMTDMKKLLQFNPPLSLPFTHGR